MPAMKLHKLAYYAQAWSLVWDDKPLFRDRIEAWVDGPVIPRLYRLHRGFYEVSRKRIGDLGTHSSFNSDQKDTMDLVINKYGDKSAGWLSELTHREAPWREARAGLAPLERGKVEITRESICEYYSSLL